MGMGVLLCPSLMLLMFLLSFLGIVLALFTLLALAILAGRWLSYKAQQRWFPQYFSAVVYLANAAYCGSFLGLGALVVYFITAVRIKTGPGFIALYAITPFAAMLFCFGCCLLVLLLARRNARENVPLPPRW